MKAYDTVHGELRRARGRAADHTCTCGQSAAEWAYLYNGDPEIRDHRGRQPYAEDIMRCYAPMCRKCHKKHDFEKDPEVAAERRELGRKVGLLKTETKQAAARANIKIAQAALDPVVMKGVGQRLGKLRSDRLKNDPEYAEQQREQSRRNASVRRKCAECPMESHPPGIGSHQRSSGHRGYTEI